MRSRLHYVKTPIVQPRWMWRRVVATPPKISGNPKVFSGGFWGRNAASRTCRNLQSRRRRHDRIAGGAVIEFQDDDHGYLKWLAEHTDGYVLNVRGRPDRGYAVLHRPTCSTISNRTHAPGAYTSRGYRKYVAEDVADLAAAARREGRSDGSFSKRCAFCIDWA